MKNFSFEKRLFLTRGAEGNNYMHDINFSILSTNSKIPAPVSHVHPAGAIESF
jgi:hypothetical protein